ncbi:MAG: efflux RND transporter periplasmic adaptor subunit [Prevotellaceae bacterium]|jgi:membrane fusion protein (multidrug efflux system)|nr:efflux RND transporter periplasmic adaptor subunit [Prevotellaceae bacterium]
MTKKTKIILLAVLALLIAGMIFFPSIKRLFSPKEQSPQQTSAAQGRSARSRLPLNVNTQVLEYETLNDMFRTRGFLLPDEEVDLSFETSGKITDIYFKEGAAVQKGQLLAKVNDKPLQAELKKIESQMPLAQERVKRQEALLKKDAVSQEAYESVATELEKLKADVELVKARIAQTELRAPFDGIIGLRQVSEGAYASPATIVSHLTKISPLKIEFSVNEKQADDIKPGTKLQFTLDGSMKTYQAEVYAVETNLERQTLTLKARAYYANADKKLKPGHSVAIETNIREISNTLVAPAISIIAEMGRDIVYVYRGGKARRVEVKKGLRTASSVQILSGLQQGDTLITSGVMQLRDGLAVEIADLQ